MPVVNYLDSFPHHATFPARLNPDDSNLEKFRSGVVVGPDGDVGTIATDPFFRPLENPGYLMQRVQPLKHEAIYGGDLAIGSANLHHDHFGAAFAINRDERAAHTACIAFGIERWLFTLTDRHGPDPGSWPDPPERCQASGSHM